MLVIVGLIIIFGGVGVGFAMAAGHASGGGLNFGAIGGLMHLSEFISLGGMTVGCMVVMSPMSEPTMTMSLTTSGAERHLKLSTRASSNPRTRSTAPFSPKSG